MRELPSPIVEQYYQFVDAAQPALTLDHSGADSMLLL
jgi:hypothetical protein